MSDCAPGWATVGREIKSANGGTGHAAGGEPVGEQRGGHWTCGGGESDQMQAWTGSDGGHKTCPQRGGTTVGAVLGGGALDGKWAWR